MLNTTCRFLSAGYKFIVDSQGLKVGPCCAYADFQYVDNVQQLQDWRKKINQIDSNENKNCDECNYIDRSKVRNSRRQISFDAVPDDAQVGDPSFVEIQIDTTCNGGCIMCGPWFSSYWAQELKQPVQTSKRDDYLAKIATLIDVQKIKKIIILGGEPLLSDIDERLLDLIDNPEEVEVQITTNGSIYPSDKRIQQWGKFKKVRINVSIDGIGPRFDYIRYPLKWSKVEHNILRMQEEFPDNVMLKINHVINILNLYYFDEFEQWFNQTLQGKRSWYFTPTPASGLLSPRLATVGIKNLVLEKYPKNSVPASIIENSNRNPQKLLTFLDQLDQRRKLQWTQVFPEIAKYLF